MAKAQTHLRKRLAPWPWDILQTQWTEYSQTRPEGVLLVLSSFVSTKKCFPATLYWIKWRRRNAKTISIVASLITYKVLLAFEEGRQLNSVKRYSNCLVNQFIVQFASRIWKTQVSAASMFKFLWKEAKHVTQPHLCNSCWNMFDNCWSCLTIGVWRQGARLFKSKKPLESISTCLGRRVGGG